MEKLRATITQYKRWEALTLYIDRMEGHLESDFSLAVENAKALLESIGKEICSAKDVELNTAPSINAVLKKAFNALGYNSEALVNRISGSLASIGQELGNLRNDISPTSHGKSLDELKARNGKVDLLTREFLIDSTLVVAVFLIRAFEERKDATAISDDDSELPEELNYLELEPFNTQWDDLYGEFEMGEYSYTASEILFRVDYQAYENEYRIFQETEPELDTEEEE
ncbi:MAG: hypothetical protein CML06_17125 [Pseudomonadales bacterium]|nr:hypothetical protein [Pseudomonadales bacterium]